MSKTQHTFDNHFEAFANQDLDAVMDDYVEDSVVITNMGVFRGPEEIEGLFSDLFAEFEQEGTTIEVDETVVEDDVAYFVWHAETPDNEYEFCTDTFYIPDEAIERQTFAGKIEPKR